MICLVKDSISCIVCVEAMSFNYNYFLKEQRPHVRYYWLFWMVFACRRAYISLYSINLQIIQQSVIN